MPTVQKEKKLSQSEENIWTHLARFLHNNWLILVGLFLLLIGIVSLFVIKHYLVASEGNPVAVSKTYIDFNYLLAGALNGWFAPIIAIVSSTLTFLAFYAQYKTNIDQNKRIEALDGENKIQSFENIFFKLIENHHKLVETLSFDFKSKISVIENKSTSTKEHVESRTGISCLQKFTEILNTSVTSNDLSNDNIVSEYDDLFSKHSSLLSHFLRNLYLFVKFIDEKDLREHDLVAFNDGEEAPLQQMVSPGKTWQVDSKRYEYLKILRAQLSHDQLEILALNALTSQGAAFEFYVRKYRLLKNMSIGILPQKMQELLLEKYSHIQYEINTIANA